MCMEMKELWGISGFELAGTRNGCGVETTGTSFMVAFHRHLRPPIPNTPISLAANIAKKSV